METVVASDSVCSVSRASASMPSGMGGLFTGHGSLGKQSGDDRRGGGGGGGGGGPWKVPRTDAFACPELKMHVSAAVSDNYLIRNTCGSSCVVSDARLAVSPTNSNSTANANANVNVNASDAIVFSHDSNSSGSSSSIVCEGQGRLLRSDSVLSAAGGAGASASAGSGSGSGSGSVAGVGPRPSVPLHLYHYKPAGLPLSFASMGREMGMGVVTAVRPPFSPSQWRELEQQALIFKYMMAGVPVPADLLLSIRKSLLPFAALAGSHHHPSAVAAWSSFQMGYGGNADPEPGRCRRTDGKKWRCSRDVVPDQKYCERHMHRGRHRGSRKPVEGLTATAVTASNTNSAPILGRKNLFVGGDGSQFQHYPLQLDGGASPTLSKQYRYVNGIKCEDMDHHILSLEASGSGAALSSEWRVASKEAGTGSAPPFSEFRIQNNGFTLNQNSSSAQIKSLMGQQFGLMSEGSEAANPNPAQQHQHSFFGGNSRYGRVQEAVREEQPLRRFFDDWPRSSTDADAWTSDVQGEEERSRSKHRCSSTTQLSISIPMASNSSASNTSSPRGKLSLSPLKLTMSREGKGDDDHHTLGEPDVGLAVGMSMNVEEPHDRQQHWIPVAWESNNPMGMLGPLAEVLRSSTPRGNKPGLNLMDDHGINKSGERGRQSPGSCIASSPT
ncbi:hypothetical protein KI387_001644, partial [Taxus chinensis]